MNKLCNDFFEAILGDEVELLSLLDLLEEYADFE